MMVIVRPTQRAEARQVHPLVESKCDCHDIIKWIGYGHVVGAGLEVNDETAEPLDWIVKIGDDVRIVKAKDFPLHYEIIENQSSD